MMIYSYCRVSTQQQSLERQEEAVKKYCQENNIKVDKEFSDKISGKTFERKEYLEMKDLVQKDDVIFTIGVSEVIYYDYEINDSIILLRYSSSYIFF